MKKIILSFAFFASINFAQAQITINRSDIAKSPTKIRYSVDENYIPTVIENKGTGLTWDFKNLIEDDIIVTIYDDPKNYPDAGKFPTANLAIISDSSDTDVSFIEDTNDSLVYVGSNGDNPMGDLRIRMLVFPMSFNTKWVDKFQTSNIEVAEQGDPYDSIKYDLDFTYTNEVEAEGKILLPNGSIDVIKLFSLMKGIGIASVKMGGFWLQIDSSTFYDSSYSFYAKNNGDAVLRLSKNEDGTYYTTYKNDILGLASINKIKQLENAVRVFPNPTTNYLNIESAKVDSYIITDILGKNIMEGKTNSNIDVSNLAKGNYMIQLFQNDKLMSVNKFIKN